MERRLAAILVADIAGYSALMGQDEAGTVATYKGHFAAMEPIIGLHDGRIVKTMGDGFLAEFGSVVNAVSAASVMQDRMVERNTPQPPERKMQFRMGVHVGDVIVDGDDILGDGVNIAARLQLASAPGGVVISGRVYDDVVDRLDLKFTALGPQQFKNIARPIPAFALNVVEGKQARPTPKLPDKPSIAVLPFSNMSPASEQEYFADGVSEEIITALSYVPWMFVVARNSSFAFKGLSVDVREIGRQLGVRYILEGSVRRAGNQLRVTGQLVDGENGAHLWADRFDGTVDEVFDLQDRIASGVVGAIAPEIRGAEIARVGRKRPDSLDAYDHYLQALAAIHRARIDDAERHLDESVRLAPAYAKARALRAWCTTLSPWISKPPDPGKIQAAAVDAEEILEALDTDPEDEAYAGYVLAFSMRDAARGLRLVERSIERCPSFAWAWTSSALLHAYRGYTNQAIERAQQALLLSPNDPTAFRSYLALCIAQTAEGNFDEVLTAASLGRELNPRMLLFLRFEMIALAHLGRLEDARKICARHMEMAPGFRISDYRDSSKPMGRVLSDKVRLPQIEGMRIAGVPE